MISSRKYLLEDIYFDYQLQFYILNLIIIYKTISQMFRRFIKPIATKIFRPQTLLTCATILAYSFYRNKVMLNQIIVEQSNDDHIQPQQIQRNMSDLQKYIKELQTVDVCQGKHIPEGGRRLVLVKDFEGNDRKIMILRAKGKLFAISGVCPHKQPFDNPNEECTLQKALFINDKLFCPHHGCIFDIKSGSIQHGPALNNLSIFSAQQVNGKVKLLYPLAIPKAVAPNYAERDIEDLRKVVILGGDDAATVGCINGLRQFGYQGQITVVKEGNLQPFKKQYLHKSIINLHLNDEKDPKGKVQKSKDQAQKKSSVDSIGVQNFIRKQLQQKIYKKLQYYRKQWYEKYGIDFILNEEPFRIINKQFYPYITFIDSTKQEFDALMIATGVSQKMKTYESINVDQQGDIRMNLPQNVFSPFRSKEQHTKLLTFLNKNAIKKLLVVGYSIQSLEFIQALNKEFPQIKISVIDQQENSQISEILGPDIQKQLAKEFTSRGVDFYIKIRDQLLFSNKFSNKNLNKKAIKDNKISDSKLKKSSPLPEINNDKLKYYQSVTVRLSDELRIKADGVVLFPHQFVGNTQWVKNGKYTDFDYSNNQRLGADTFGRTQNLRIFSAGYGSANEYYMSGGKRLVHFSPNVSYEQGFNVALNMQALRIPFTYVTLDHYNFFNKRLMYLGTREFYDSVLIMGSVQDWDFLAVYALGNKVNAVTASPSRSKQMSIMREAFRVNCVPQFQDLTSGYWSIQNLEKLIRKLNKTGCYRDLIFQSRQNIHKKDLIWMQRSPDAGFQNDRPIQSEQYPSVEVGDGGVLKEL